MKIVFTGYINSPQYTAPEAWLTRIEGYKEILEALACFHEVHSIEQINYTGDLSHNGVQYHFLNFKKKDLLFPYQLHKYIKALKPDIVLVHSFVFPLQVVQLKWTLGKNTRIIIQNHAEKPFPGWKKNLQKYADRYVDTYLFTSLEIGDDWLNHKIISGKNKIVDVMEASSCFTIMEKVKARETTRASGHPSFLWVGRLDRNKDPLTVIKAFILFLLYEPLSKLYMIYHTEELLTEIRQFIEANDKAKTAIVLIGKIPHKDMKAWFNSCDFIISASHYEGSGVAVCEAMSCGCIPIVTNIASFRKMTGNGKCGFLYEPGKTNELLSVLLQTTQLNIEEEKEKVLEQFNKELSCEAIAYKMNGVMNHIVKNSGKPIQL
jgi:glycosyltransferase involved in cell wall biosynthesis